MITTAIAFVALSQSQSTTYSVQIQFEPLEMESHEYVNASIQAIKQSRNGVLTSHEATQLQTQLRAEYDSVNSGELRMDGELKTWFQGDAFKYTVTGKWSDGGSTTMSHTKEGTISLNQTNFSGPNMQGKLEYSGRLPAVGRDYMTVFTMSGLSGNKKLIENSGEIFARFLPRRDRAKFPVTTEWGTDGKLVWMEAKHGGTGNPIHRLDRTKTGWIAREAGPFGLLTARITLTEKR